MPYMRHSTKNNLGTNKFVEYSTIHVKFINDFENYRIILNNDLLFLYKDYFQIIAFMYILYEIVK